MATFFKYNLNIQKNYNFIIQILKYIDKFRYILDFLVKKKNTTSILHTFETYFNEKNSFLMKNVFNFFKDVYFLFIFISVLVLVNVVN